MTIADVNASGKAPAGLDVGDLVKTANGYFTITDNENDDYQSVKNTSPYLQELIADILIFSKSSQGSHRLSADFTVNEFACQDNSNVVLIDQRLVDVLQDIRNHFGKPIRITSGYRTVSHNADVGGASNSQHTYGRAADITISGVSYARIKEYADNLPEVGYSYIGTGFIHIDVRK